jgi:pyruvate dehydrogenase E2 component (dihydrolipoyllysine-residue acetyltransferase)
MATDFTLPELGENITAGDVLRVLVKPGDTLEKDQPVLELETDKATIEVPSSVAGRVKDIKVKSGDKVKVGQAILSVEDGASAERGPAAVTPKQAPATSEPAKADTKPPQPARVEQTAAGANTAAKVPEDGGLEQHVEGVKRTTAADKPGVSRDNVVDISRGARPVESAAPAAPETPPAPAAPSVRRTARELGVNIDEVSGTGPGGRISVEDVKSHVKRVIESAGRGAAGAAAEPLPDFSRWGDVERQPMRAVRRKTAEHLSVAWATVPHVTQCDVADITGLEELRKKYSKQAEAAGGNLTVTAIAVKVVASALKVFPQVNASVDIAASEIVLKKYVNIGIAVDTDRGLLVPVIRNADQKNIIQISVELTQLSEKARSRKIALEEMQGGTFSISNLGGIGGTYFTPIVNAPEVAILGISRAKMEPVYTRLRQGSGGQEDGAFVPRLMLPLSLSYDHRVIDGADGIRFLRWIVEALEQPFLLTLAG